MKHPPPYLQDCHMDAAAPKCSPTLLILISFYISSKWDDSARGEVPHKAAHFIVTLRGKEAPHGLKGESEAVSRGGSIGLGAVEYGIHLSVGMPHNPYARQAAQFIMILHGGNCIGTAMVISTEPAAYKAVRLNLAPQTLHSLVGHSLIGSA